MRPGVRSAPAGRRPRRVNERCTFKDGQNSVRKVVDTTGVVVASYDYDAWGSVLGQDQPSGWIFNHRAFGEIQDPNLGMTYLRARWMDAGTGRFESRDPVCADCSNPQSLHRYTYANLNPVENLDPSGEFSVDAGLIFGAGMNALYGTETVKLNPFGSSTAYGLFSFDPPADKRVRQLAGVIYAESRSSGQGGEDSDEKLAIGWTFANVAYYATYRPPSAKRCYNSTFGDGTVLGSIQGTSKAYGSSRWNDVMAGDDLKPVSAIRGAIGRASQIHFLLSLDAARSVNPDTVPQEAASLDSRIPLQINQAENSPPNPERQERIGHLGAHTFYAFKVGRECQ